MSTQVKLFAHHSPSFGTHDNQTKWCIDQKFVLCGHVLLYPDSGISMDEEIVLGDMMWSYNKAEL